MNYTYLAMEYKHYQFSDEAKPTLLEFYEIARTKKQNNHKSTTWQLLLPKNEKLISELNDMQLSSVINISDDELITNEDETKHVDTFRNNADSLNEYEYKLTINDIAETVKEQLEIEDILNDRSLEKLMNLSEPQIKEVFIILAKNLDTESICKLGNGILKNSLANIKIMELFVKYILIPKLFIEYNTQSYSLFVSFLSNQLSLTSRALSYAFAEMEDCTKSIQENLAGLNCVYKQNLLREFILQMEKLDKNHLLIVDCLISKQIDCESIQKLIELLLVASSIFSNDKVCGKLLLNLISNCKGRIGRFEQQLTHIINQHKSVWKSKLNKVLIECMKDNLSLSQSIRY